MAFYLVFPIALDKDTVDDVDSCPYIKEVGVWVQLAGAVSKLNTYFIGGFEESAMIGDVTRKAYLSTEALSDGMLCNAAVDVKVVSVR